jgi:PBP1b-binding outer membrane lipoprotein LpoB
MGNIMKYIKLSVITCLAFFIFGCSGYKSGSISNPKYKTIAIAPIKNNSMEPLASAYLRKLLAEHFMTDGSMRVVKPEAADCILYVTIDKVETTASSYDSADAENNYTPSEWSMRMYTRFSVVEPGKSRPVVKEREINESSRYTVTVDQYSDRRLGLELLSHDIAQEIVQYTVEAW